MIKHVATVVTLLGVLALARADCPGDINGSGTVDVDDLLILLAGWGDCGAPPCDSDINGDNDTNVDDLLLLLGGFGPCPPETTLGCGGAAGIWATGGCGRLFFESDPNGFLNTTEIIEEVFASNDPDGCVLPRNTNATFESYPVQGGDLIEVSEVIFDPQNGAGFLEDGKRYAGQTEFWFEYTGKVTEEIVKEKVFYQLTDIRFSLIVKLPAWNPPNGAPPNHVAEWERFLTALRVHEIGHVGLYKQQHAAIVNRLKDTPAGLISVQGITESLFDSDGNPNEAMWNKIFDAAGAVIRANPNFLTMVANNEAYDAPQSDANPTGTDHGKTQDATLNPFPPE